MASFNDALVATDYTHGYARLLNPLMLRFACLRASVVPPPAPTEDSPWRYLELGFGQGLSVNMHAAGIAGQFWGTDYNPAHAARACDMATAAGAGARLFHASFAELLARDDLPQFDAIGLHGIWSWITAAVGADVLAIVAKHLRPGGLVYLSYNCAPGWTQTMPLQQLMRIHAETTGGNPIAAMDAAVGYLNTVLAAGVSPLKADPAVEMRLKQIAGMHRNYLVHEYLAPDFRVLPFADVAQDFASISLQFAAPAFVIDAIDGINLTADGTALLATIDNIGLRETTRDFLTHRGFRRDIYVKGRRALAPLQQTEALLAERFVLARIADDISYKTAGPIGEITLQENLFRPLIAALAQHNYAAKTAAVLHADPALAGFSLPMLFEALAVLIGTDQAELAQVPTAAGRAACKRLNAHLIDLARTSLDVEYLASPVTGGGVPVSRIQQLFLLAMQRGKQDVVLQAEFVWQILASQGHRLVVAGQPLEGDAESIAELTRNAEEFVAKRLPILQAMEIM